MKYSAAANSACNLSRPEVEAAADRAPFGGNEGHLMLHPPTFRHFEDAYCAVLKHVGPNFGYVIASRGKCARECLNVSFVVDDRRDRVVYAPARRTNIVFCFAEALWYLWGRDDLDMIGYYAPRIAAFSADGQRLTGSAYGPKLFQPASAGRSQWERVLGVLAEDPASKLAVVSFFEPSELAEPANPDVSCTLGLQFLLREGQLHAAVYMRGNDAVVGLLSDVFSFTFIQEFTALQLGVSLGSYGHHVGSMHINHDDAGRAAKVASADRGTRVRFPAQAMPPTRWDDLKVVERHEKLLRRDEERLDPGGLSRLGLDPYWQQVVLLFDVYRQIAHYPGRRICPTALEALDPGYRWLIAHRWPDRIPGEPAAIAGRRA
jgi:thymidylate synthase